MSDTEPTTGRAQRRQAAASGSRSDAVDRVNRDANPRGRGRDTGTRQRQQQRRREVAEEIDIERDGVGAVDRIGEGIDVFLRSMGVREFDENVSRRFAQEADFVGDPEAAFPGAREVDARVDGQRISASPVVAPDRRSDVATRARTETADETDFVERSDLRADVGPRGVRRLEIDDGTPATQRFASFEDADGSEPSEDVRRIVRQRPGEDRSEDVAERTRAGLASEDRFARPSDFAAEVGRRGIAEGSLTDDGAQRRAGRQFEAETALRSVDPFEDVRAVEDGFDLTEDAQQRQAARGFERELELFDTGDLGTGDVREFDDGFGLAREPARRLGAARIDEQLPDVDVSVGDIELEETPEGFEAAFEREVRR